MNSHADLFWALRGAGSSNFGIVTSFVVAVIKLPNPRGLWAGIKAYSQASIPRVLDDMYNFWTKSQIDDRDIAGINFYTFTSGENRFSLVTSRTHAIHDDPESWPHSLSRYHTVESIPGTSKSLISSIAPYTASLGHGFEAGRRNIWFTSTYRPSREFETHLYSIFEEEAVKLKDVEGCCARLSTQLAPCGSRLALTTWGGGNCLGLTEESGPLVIILYTWSYTQPADHHIVEETAIKCFDRIEVKANDLGVSHPFRYINYADEKYQAQQVWDGYGRENVSKLRRIQKSIDPTGVFTDGGLASGYFKLNKI
jgi:hypothetical protein